MKRLEIAKHKIFFFQLTENMQYDHINSKIISFLPLTKHKTDNKQASFASWRISSAFHLPQTDIWIFNVAQGHLYLCTNVRPFINSKCRCIRTSGNHFSCMYIWWYFFLLCVPLELLLHFFFQIYGSTFLFARMSFDVSRLFFLFT